jgi:hypothetical protein
LRTCIKGVAAQRTQRPPTCDDDSWKKPVQCPRNNDGCPECDATVSVLRRRPAEAFFACWKQNGAICFQNPDDAKQQACLREAVTDVCGVTDTAIALCAQLECTCAPAEGFEIEACEKFVSALSPERASWYMTENALPCATRDMFYSVGPSYE